MRGCSHFKVLTSIPLAVYPGLALLIHLMVLFLILLILIFFVHHGLFLHQLKKILHLFFWPHCVACMILVPQPGIKLLLQEWKCRVPITGLPEKSLYF